MLLTLPGALRPVLFGRRPWTRGLCDDKPLAMLGVVCWALCWWRWLTWRDHLFAVLALLLIGCWALCATTCSTCR